MFAKRQKIDGKSIRLRISTQPSDNFAFFPLSEATWSRFGSPRGGSGASWAPFRLPEESLGRPGPPPGRPWDAPGVPRGRSEALPERLWGALDAPRSILGAQNTSQDRFLVDFGIDYGVEFQAISGRLLQLVGKAWPQHPSGRSRFGWLAVAATVDLTNDGDWPKKID